MMMMMMMVNKVKGDNDKRRDVERIETSWREMLLSTTQPAPVLPSQPYHPLLQPWSRLVGWVYLERGL
jgi:hypothetical protein